MSTHPLATVPANAAERYQLKLQLIIENDSNGVLVLCSEGLIQFANPAAAQMFGRSAEDLIGESFGLPMTIDTVTQIEVLRQGRPCPVEMRITPITWPEEPALLVSLHDLSERIKFEQELAFRDTHDTLTGLPGQSLLLEALTQAIYAARRAGTLIALMVIKLNRLALLNASLGHGTTDALQIELARRLQTMQPLPHTVARIHNDELVYVMDGLSDDSSITRLTAILMQVLTSSFEWQGTPLNIEPCIGISIYPKDADEAAPLLQSAEIALYQARQQGRGGFMLASPELNEQAQRRVANEVALRRGLANEEMEMFYQPRVSLASGHITGAEALIRWRDPERGLIPPMEFIPLAEETGLIIPMTEWVLKDVCRQQKAWLDAGVRTVPVSVNLCADHFRDEKILDSIKAALDNSSLPPELLEVEITETIAMENAEQTIARLKKIRELGVMIALDDFGTGYSSLSYLERFPIDILKIDISFVQGVINSPDDAAITTAIIAMAHQLGYEVVAEGVEREDQRQFLHWHRCEEGQGFLFSRPLPAVDFEQLLRSDWCYPDQPLNEPIETQPVRLVLLDSQVQRRHLVQQFLQRGGFEVVACAIWTEVESCLLDPLISMLLMHDEVVQPYGAQLLALAASYPALSRVMLAPPTSHTARKAAAEGSITHILSTAMPPQRQLNYLRKLVAVDGHRA
jgi:diguanylate cyclase (GGDEF)-like protein